LTRRSRLTAEEAASRLGVRRATLYAYVSRGLIRSEPQQGTRERLYHAEDVDLLVRRRSGRQDPSRMAQEALHWGTPVLESGLTRIADGSLHFRGREATGLVDTLGFEGVAALLWGLDPEGGLPEVEPLDLAPVAPLLPTLPPIERLQVALASASAVDLAAYDRSPDAVRRTGTRILHLLARAAAGASRVNGSVSELLQRGWLPDRPDAAALLEAALVLWADHELNVGTFTVRCVASAQATPYAAAIAGLSALGGALHGGVTDQVEALFDEARAPADVERRIGARLRRGERIPGFGHWLYPDGDPRAAALLARLRAHGGVSREALDLTDALERTTQRVTGRSANVDFATVALRRSLGMPEGSALALIGVARSVGWIAHVLEQYATGRLIRPRARYTGPSPTGTSAEA
jgi:citrate synthase